MTGIAAFATGAPTYTILDAGDPTGHTAWGFPGMQFKVNVSSAGYGSAIKSVTFTFSTNLLDLDLGGERPVRTTYSPDFGYAQEITGQADSYKGVTDTVDSNTWALPKDAGNTTINVTMIPWVYTPNGYVAGAAVTDALLMKSEPVTVSPFTITGSPMWAGITDGDNPNPAGAYYGLMMAGGTPTSRAAANYTAFVTNSTHYDLQIGFVQTLDAVQFSDTYSDGSFQSIAGSNLLDSTQTNIVWYSPDDYGRVNAGGTDNISSWDSPAIQQRLVKAAGPPAVSLTAITLSGQFQTHVVVYGGWNGWQTSAPSVPGVPIALSTAAWHVYGNVSGLLTATPTVSLGAGGGPLPTTLPGPNAAWTSSGDGVAKYLSWNGNLRAQINSGGISGVIFATPSEEAGILVPSLAWNEAFDRPDRSRRRPAGPDRVTFRPAPFHFGSRSDMNPVVNVLPRNLPDVISPRKHRLHDLQIKVLTSGGQ